MKHGVAGVVALAFAFQSGLATAQQEPVRLAPASNWNLDYSEDSCALRRLFGEEGQRVFLEMRQFGPSSELVTTISSADFDRRSRMNSFSIMFAPDDAPVDDISPMGIESETFGEGAMFTTSLLRHQQRELADALIRSQQIALAVTEERRDAREAEIEGMQVSGLFRQSVYLQTGSLHPAMIGMRACIDELLGHWGIDADAHRTLLRPVQSVNQDQWARELVNRYPTTQLMRGEQAYVRIRLNVSVEGRATECAVQSRFNDERFDELACELLMEHSRFEPALDGNGVPIPSFWQTAVIYRIS